MWVLNERTLYSSWTLLLNPSHWLTTVQQSNENAPWLHINALSDEASRVLFTPERYSNKRRGHPIWVSWLWVALTTTEAERAFDAALAPAIRCRGFADSRQCRLHALSTLRCTLHLKAHFQLRSFPLTERARETKLFRFPGWVGVVRIVAMEKDGGASQILMLSICVAAIYGAYITQGVVQENVWVSRPCGCSVISCVTVTPVQFFFYFGIWACVTISFLDLWLPIECYWAVTLVSVFLGFPGGVVAHGRHLSSHYFRDWLGGCLSFCRSTRRYGEKGERFEQLTFLNLAQSVVCLFWSLLSKRHRTLAP